MIMLVISLIGLSEAKPFYETRNGIIVLLVIGILIVLCCVVPICNYCQTEYKECLCCRPCVQCLMCKTTCGYEEDDQGDVPFDVSEEQKRELARRQRV